MTEEPKRDSSQPQSIPTATVRQLVDRVKSAIGLARVAGESGLGRPLRHPRIQKSGLALAGHFFGLVPTRVQVLGETELSYLETLSHEQRSQAARAFFAQQLSCVITTKRTDAPRELVLAAEATSTPLFTSGARTSPTINAVHAVLDELLAPSLELHGVLVDVFGIGMLILGKSGIGKSECAIELVLRGHRLVADDIVRCEWRPPGMVFGSPKELLKHHVEVRGLGVLNVKDMFGVTAVRERKRIDIVTRLEEWDEASEYERLGVDDRFQNVLGTQIRLLVVPVRPGRDMASILEMAARNELLRRAGTHSARDLLSKLEETASVASATLAVDDDAPSSSFRAPPAPVSSTPRAYVAGAPSGHESSAWIPAVRPKGDE